MANLMLWLLTTVAIFASVSSIENKCGACISIAEEIEYGLSNEKPRNHLDMRHRLDSQGQRRGKVIDYRVSDLRVFDLLDGLCEKMEEYTLEQINSTNREWIKVHSWNSPAINKQKARVYSKVIASYCGRLLEETEDELAELIKEGSVKVGGVSKVLCEDLSQQCGQTSGSGESYYDREDELEEDDSSDEL